MILEQYDRPKVLAHIDSVQVNFLVTQDSMYLLDWEYAGMSDPLIDVAMFVVYGGLNKDESLEFLKEYLGRDGSNEEQLILYAYMALSGFLWALWTQLKQVNGEDFGTYGIEQYQYARTYARKVIKMSHTK